MKQNSGLNREILETGWSPDRSDAALEMSWVEFRSKRRVQVSGIMGVGIPSQVIGRRSANSSVWPVAMRIIRPQTYGLPGLGQLHDKGRSDYRHLRPAK